MSLLFIVRELQGDMDKSIISQLSSCHGKHCPFKRSLGCSDCPLGQSLRDSSFYPDARILHSIQCAVCCMCCAVWVTMFKYSLWGYSVPCAVCIVSVQSADKLTGMQKQKVAGGLLVMSLIKSIFNTADYCIFIFQCQRPCNPKLLTEIWTSSSSSISISISIFRENWLWLIKTRHNYVQFATGVT